MLEGDGLLQTAAAKSGAAPGFGRRRDVGGRTPTVAVGTGFKTWEKFLHFEKKGPLVGDCRGETEGLRPAPPPGGCSCSRPPRSWREDSALWSSSPWCGAGSLARRTGAQHVPLIALSRRQEVA